MVGVCVAIVLCGYTPSVLRLHRQNSLTADDPPKLTGLNGILTADYTVFYAALRRYGALGMALYQRCIERCINESTNETLQMALNQRLLTFMNV